MVVENDIVVESWTGVTGETGLQEIQGISGYTADEMELVAIMDEGSYMAITEVSSVLSE